MVHGEQKARLRERGYTLHAQERMWQRFGLELTEARAELIRREILSGKLESVFRPGINLPIYFVSVSDHVGPVVIPVLWDPKLRCIVSILPE